MENSRYDGGLTRGGKWGCALSLIVCIPFAIFLAFLHALGHCEPGIRCHRGLLLDVILPTAVLAAVVGLGARWLVNWTTRNDS
jgi:hypothetical protein